MPQKLEDTTNNLLTQFMSYAEVDHGEKCTGYLRGSCQKLIFAKERLKTLEQHINLYNEKIEKREPLNSIYILMDFDHLITSLRGSLSQLAYLISLLISKDMPSFILKEETMNLKKLAERIQEDNLINDIHIYSLVNCLKYKFNQDWYKDLYNQRVEILPDKLKKFPKVSTKTIEQQLLNFSFLLNTGDNELKEEEKNIISYSKYLINEVETTLIESFGILHNYLLIH
ncbi:MAG: hypothetical protein NTV30_10720 [Chloroflexi bacterium]|nr:hypothetical protein [Chloroflexota bacterium]